MKLRIFQSDKGDCLLLQGADGKNVLCDGGMARSMRRHVRHLLPRLVGDGGRLDSVYVSHIDQDHISGVLQLLNDALDWKVHRFHRDNGDTSVRRPAAPEPPVIDGLWHNAFRDQVDENAGSIGDLLAASSPLLIGTSEPSLVDLGVHAQKIAQSIPEALKVSRLCKADLLNIPINTLPGSSDPSKLLYFRDTPAPFDVGGMTFTIIGPTERELDDLRDGWNNWLGSNHARLEKIKAELRRQVDAFASGRMTGTPFDLRRWNDIPSYDEVSVPNVASLMFMVEENGKRLLLTGDSHQDKILEGLRAAGFLDDGSLHLDALKVQHHGSEHNLDKDFVKQISADHYIFCGDGSHGNPEPSVIDDIYQSRLGSSSRRALAPVALDRPFTFWFSTNTESLPELSKKRTNFADVEALIDGLISDSNGQLSAEFVKRDYRTLTID